MSTNMSGSSTPLVLALADRLGTADHENTARLVEVGPESYDPIAQTSTIPVDAINRSATYAQIGTGPLCAEIAIACSAITIH